MSATANEDKKYAPGDWIVHCHHGVGRIKVAERKRIGDKETRYFRIEMIDSTIWIPVGHIDSGQIRPVSKRADFQRAIEELEREPGEMDSNMNLRRIQINTVVADNDPVGTARLVRDLKARQHNKGTMNESERRVYRALSDRLIQEWAVCMGVKIEEARFLLDQMLRVWQTSAAGGAESDDLKGSSKGGSLLDALTHKDKKWAQWFTQQKKKGASVLSE